MVVAGWIFHSAVLIQLRPMLAPMQFNTALCFLLTGMALAVWGWGRDLRTIPILGGCVATIAGLTMAEYLFHADLGIDQLLFRCYITTETSNAGRMSPVSSFCLIL